MPRSSATWASRGWPGTPSARTTAAGAPCRPSSIRRWIRAPSSAAMCACSWRPMTWMRFGWMRLRWPTNAADSVASARMTAPPPDFPPIQASSSFSAASSYSRATLVCNIRLPRGDELVEGGGVGDRGEALAQLPVAEHLRQLAEDLEMLLGRLLRHEQHEDQVHRAAVGRVERDRGLEAEERADRLLQALDPAVGDRHALAEPGGTEALAREEAVEHHAAGDALVVLEQEPHLLEHPLLAARLGVEDDVRLREQLGDQIHPRVRKFGGALLYSHGYPKIATSAVTK